MPVPVFLRPAAFAAALLLILAPFSVGALPVEAVKPINSRDYAPAVRTLIQNAKKSIYLQLYQARFYTEYPDTASNRFLEDLEAALKRGVEVSVVIDTGDWNPNQKNEYNLEFVDRLTAAGAKVWEDSPEEVSHQKVLLIDEEITVIGSLNWTFYSLAQNNEAAAVIRSVPLNKWFRAYFCERAAGGKPRGKTPAMDAASCARLKEEVGGATSQAVSAGKKRSKGELPALDVKPIPNRVFYPVVHDALLSATKSIDVVQRSIQLSSAPPLGPGGRPPLPGEPDGAVDVLVEDLIAARKRGVKVRVVLDHTEKMEDAGNAEAALYLKENGVEVFSEDPKVQTHAKMLVIDGNQVILGSTNWTRSAVEVGNEASVLITSAEVGSAYKQFVESLIKKGGRYEARPASIWRSAAEGP